METNFQAYSPPYPHAFHARWGGGEAVRQAPQTIKIMMIVKNILTKQEAQL